MNVSVIIPVYNGEAFLQRAIRSVFQQSQLPLELIIVDDASTDNSQEIIRNAIVGAPIPVRVFQLDTNSGSPAKPLNQGSYEAKGDLLAVLDQDDYFLNDKLKELTAALLGTPDARLIFSDFMGVSRFSVKVITEGKVWLEQKFCEQTGLANYVYLDSKTAIYGLLRYTNICPSFSGMIFFREDLIKKGGFDESLKVGSDYDFMCWVALRYKIVYSKKAFFYKEVHENNLSRHAISGFENSLVFLNYLWQARAKGFLCDDKGLREKAVQRVRIYVGHCRKNKCFHAPLALNSAAVKYFRVNFYWLKSIAALCCVWFYNYCVNRCKKSDFV